MERRNHMVLYLCIAGMLLGAFARNVIGMNIPVVLFLLFTVIVALKGTPNEILAFSVTMMVFSRIFQYKYGLLILIAAFFFRQKKFKVFAGSLCIVAMMAWELLHMGIGGFSVTEFFRNFAEFLLIFAVINYEKDLDVDLISRMLLISVVGICSIMFYIQLQQAGSFSMIFARGWRNFRFGTTTVTGDSYALNFNANGLGSICNVAIAGTMQCVLLKKAKKIDVLLMGMCIIFGLLTMSRTFIICCVLQFIMWTFLSDIKLSRKIQLLVFGGIGLSLIILIVNIAVPQIMLSITERFSEADLSNGRMDLITFYNEHIFSTPGRILFGLGVQNFAAKLASIYGSTVVVCHNGIQEILVAWGLPGLVMFAWLIVFMLHRAKRINSLKLMYAIPLLLVFVISMAGQLIRSEITMLSLAFAYICLCRPVQSNSIVKTA